MEVNIFPNRLEIIAPPLIVGIPGTDLRSVAYRFDPNPNPQLNAGSWIVYVTDVYGNSYDIPTATVTNHGTWKNGEDGAKQAVKDISAVVGYVPSSPPALPGVQDSIEYSGSNLRLVGDDPAPGPDHVFGTDAAGNKGWKPDPSGGNAIEGLTGDVSATGPGTVAATIQPDAVTNSKLANMAQARFKLRSSGAGAGDPQDGDANAASTILDGATDPFLRTSALPPIPTLTPNTNVVYVSKVGNDSDTGLTVADPKLTINSALTAALALSPAPAAVYVLDAGEYTEDLTLGSVPVIAPSATLIGRVDMGANAMLVVKNHYPAIDASVAVGALNQTGYAYYICADKLDVRGKAGGFTSCDAVRNQYNGMVLHVKCPVIIGSQTAVYATNNTTGHIHLDVNDIYCTRSGNVGLYATDTVGVGGRIYGKVDHIINISGATSSIGVWTASANSFISITSNEINTDTAYNCTVGSLYLICPRILGTRTGTPVFEASTHIVTGTQPLDADLTAIAALSTNGLVERTGAGTAAIRAIGVTASTDIPSRADADARYKPIQVTGLTLTTGAWTLASGLYEQSISDANITTSSIVDVIPNNADFAVVAAASFLPRTDSASGSVKVYCNNLPSGNIGVTINILNT